MVSVDDIVDGESLEAWLKALPSETPEDEARVRGFVIALAVRSAARVLPRHWLWTVHSKDALNRDLTPLPLLRSLLISSVASLAPTDDIRGAAAAAYAAYAADAYAYAAAAYAADAYAAAAAAAYAAAAAIWKNVRQDCKIFRAGSDVWRRDLWDETAAPPSDPWMELLPLVRGKSGDWDFWIEWYEQLRAGKMMPLDLLTKIALIDPKTWDEGPEVVNPIIAKMWLESGQTKTLNGERVVLAPETMRLSAVPETTLPSDHLRDALDKLRDANRIFDGEDGENRMYEVLQPERAIIADALERYAARPMRLFDASRRAAGRVRQKIEAGDCPDKDALINDYVGQLDEAAVDLRGFDETIQKVTTNRVIDGMKDLPAEQIDDVITAADEVAQASDGYMATELPDLVRSGVDRTKPAGERKEDLNRAVGLLLQSWSVGRKHLENSAKLTKDIGIDGGLGVGIIDGMLWMSGKLPIVLPWLLSLF